MGIKFDCGVCFRRITAKDELAGKRIKCPDCANTLLVPDAARADAFYGKAIVLIERESHEQAINALDKAIELNYQDAKLFHARARARRLSKHFEDAIADYSEAVRLKPNVAEYWWSRGNLLDDMSQFDRAIADFTQAIKVDPTFVNAFVCRGVSLIHKRKYEQAIADYSEALVSIREMSMPSRGEPLPLAQSMRTRRLHRTDTHTKQSSPHKQPRGNASRSMGGMRSSLARSRAIGLAGRTNSGLNMGSQRRFVIGARIWIQFPGAKAL